MYFEDLVTDRGGSVDDAKSVISLLLMVSNILVIPMALVSGIACDKFKIWKIMIISILVLVSF